MTRWSCAGVVVVLVGCGARRPDSVGRPCSTDVPCGPGAVCDTRQEVCVPEAGGSPELGATWRDGQAHPWPDGPVVRADGAVSDLFAADRQVAGDAGCTGGTTPCGTFCVDTQKDAKHCGGCNKSCGANGICQGGSCACSGSYQNCNSGWNDGCECAPGQQCSGSACVGPDPCAGVSCGGNATCSGGTCGCTGGYRNCNGGWGDGCECPPSKQCSGSACITPDPCAGKVCGSRAHCNPATGNCECDGAPWTNCNGSWSDGCECGYTCAGGCDSICQSGMCKCLGMC